MADEAKAKKLDDLFKKDLSSISKRDIENVIQPFVSIDKKYLTFQRIDKLCNIFIESESHDIDQDVLVSMRQSIISVLEHFVSSKEQYAAGLRTKKGFMTTVKSAMGKIQIVRDEESVQAYRRFLLLMVKLEHEAMKEARLRHDFLDVTVIMLDKLIKYNPEEWLFYMELFLRMADNQDCSKLFVSHRQAKRKKSKKKEKHYPDHYYSVVNYIIGEEELPMDVTYLITVFELMTSHRSILDESRIFQETDIERLYSILENETEISFIEKILGVYKNLAMSEALQKVLIQQDNIISYLQGTLLEPPGEEEDYSLRALAKEILWIMRDELSLSPTYAYLGTELSKIAKEFRDTVGPKVVVSLHKHINGEDDWKQLQELRDLLCIHGFMCYDLVDLDLSLPDEIDVNGQKEDIIILHKVCPAMSMCSVDGNEICKVVTDYRKKIFVLSMGEKDEGDDDFEMDLDSPDFNQEMVIRCNDMRKRALALQILHESNREITDTGFIKDNVQEDNQENRPRPKYVEVSDAVDPDVVDILTQKAWSLKRPSLIIYVNIGLESMIVTQGDRIQRFRKLLKETARSADAWIVGGAVDPDSTETNSKLKLDQDVITVGVSSSSRIKDAHSVLSTDDPDVTRPVSAQSVVLSENQGPSSPSDAASLGDDLANKLDQNPVDLFNSHFIFTKSTQNNENEDEISTFLTLGKSFSTDTEAVPNILLVVEGDKRTLQFMLEASRREIPMIVYRGTGGIADIVAHAEREFIQSRDTKSTVNKILRNERFQTMFKNDQELEKRAYDVFEVVCKRHLLSTYDFNLDNMATASKGTRIEDNILQSLHGTRFDILYKPSAIHVRKGDYYTLQLAVDAVKDDTKVILFKNSGGLADFLIHYLQDVNIETKDALILDIKARLEDEDNELENVKSNEVLAEGVLEILRKRHLVKIMKPTAYDEDDNDVIRDGDVSEKLFELLNENKLFPIVFPIFPDMDTVSSILLQYRVPQIHFKATQKEEENREESNVRDVYIDEEMFLAGGECRMMEFLLKARTYRRPDLMSILRLSLKWNRVSKEDTEQSTTAEDVLEESITQPIRMDEELLSNLRKGDLETFRLLSSKRYNFVSFFSTERHRLLYRMIDEDSPVFDLIPEKDRASTVDILTKVEELIKNLIHYDIDIHGIDDNIEEDVKNGRDNGETKHLKFLFLWATLMNYTDLARFLWRDLKDRLPAALIAYGLLYQLSKRQSNKEARRSLMDSAETFSSLAVKLLTELSKIDSKNTKEYLLVPIPDWGSDSCLNIAYKTKNRTFISAKECQMVLDMKWVSYISEEVPEKSTKSETTQSKQSDDQFLLTTATSALHVLQNIFFAPRTIFTLYLITQLVFLGLFSWFMLSVFDSNITNLECIIYAYIFGRLVEEIRQVVGSDSVKGYIKSSASKFDIFAILLFLIGICTRIPYAGYNTWEGGIEVTRVLYGLTLSTFYLRILYSCSVNRHLGPKLLMIWKMIMADLSYYSVILFLPLLAYAVTAYAVLLPNSTMNGDLVLKVLRLGYWPLYGELNLDEIEVEEPNCSYDSAVYSAGTLPRCPTSNRRIFVTIFLGVYALLSNILLLNVLIAIFSNTFQRMETETDKHAHFQRCSVIYEFSQKPFLPMPLGSFIYVYRFILFIYERCCMKSDRSKKTYSKDIGEKQQWARDHSLHLVLDDDIGKGKSSGNWGVLSMSEKIDQIREQLMGLHRQMNISEKHQVSKQTQNTSGFNVDNWKSEQRKVLRKQTRDTLLKDFKTEEDGKGLEEKLSNGLRELENKMENMRRSDEIDRKQTLEKIQEMIANVQIGEPVKPVPVTTSVPDKKVKMDNKKLESIDKKLDDVEKAVEIVQHTQELLISSGFSGPGGTASNDADVLERLQITEDRLLALENREKKHGDVPLITPSVARMRETRKPILEKLQEVRSVPMPSEYRKREEKTNKTLQKLVESVGTIKKVLNVIDPDSDTESETTKENYEEATVAPKLKAVPSLPLQSDILSKSLTQIEMKISGMEDRLHAMTTREEDMQQQVLKQLSVMKKDGNGDTNLKEMERHIETFGQKLNDAIKNDEILKRQLWEYQHKKDKDDLDVVGKVNKMEWALQTLYIRLNSQGFDNDRYAVPDEMPPKYREKSNIVQVKPAPEEEDRLRHIENTLQDMNDRLRTTDYEHELLQKEILNNLRVARGQTEEEMQLVVRNALLKEKDHKQSTQLGQLQNTVASMDSRLNQTRADIRKLKELMTEIAEALQDIRQDRIFPNTP